MRTWQMLTVAGLALAAAAGGGWYMMFGAADPPPVSLESAVQQVQVTPSPTPPGPSLPKATASVVAATIPTTAAPVATGPRTDGKVEGKWAVDGAASFVGYRVVEELARIGANTAVGRTSAVTGELTFDGRAVPMLRVAADLRQLKSDDNRRDNFVRNQSLQTERFPEAIFTLVEPIPVTTAPAEGATMSATAKGDLTVHGVTKRVDVPIEGKLAGGKLVVVGSVKVALADFGIAPPRAPVVLSVEDSAVLELSLVFTPAG